MMVPLEAIRLRRGDIISSEKYGWTKIITRVNVATDEIKLINANEEESSADGCMFSITNTMKFIENGVYKYEKRKQILPAAK